MFLESADGDERTIWFNQWAEWASKAANHQDSSAQGLRNAAGIYFSLKQYDTAAGFRERAAFTYNMTHQNLKSYTGISFTYLGEKSLCSTK